MSPFFGDEGAYFFHETCFRRVTLDEGDAAGRGFLFTPGVVGEDVLERDRSEVDPAWIGGEVKAQYVPFDRGIVHRAKLAVFYRKFWLCGMKAF